ncbi:MAG: CBS domain-containing protein [Candidatus Bathyarchaeia archaeon]|jgi:CBS domain-containing protein
MAKVKDIMTKEVVSIGVNNSVFEAAVLMGSSQIGCLVIVDGESPVGIVTERDIVRRVIAKRLPLDTKVSDIMSKSLITVDPGASLKEAARLMSSNKIRRLPVMQQNKLVGIVVAADLVRDLGKKSVSEEIIEAMGRHPATLT